MGKYSVPVDLLNEGVRRCDLSPQHLVERPKAGIDTIYDILLYASQEYGSRNAMGWRDVIDVVKEEKTVISAVERKETTVKKMWNYFQLSNFKYITFSELRESVSEIVRGMLYFGIVPGNVLSIYASTSLNWQLVSLACASISVPIATVYDSLGEKGLTHSLNETKCVGVFTNAKLLPFLLKVLPNTPCVKYIIYDGKTNETILDLRRLEDCHTFEIAGKNRFVLNLVELQEIGHRLLAVEPHYVVPHICRPRPDTVACIMYTSGSTGNPKGVVIRHRNLVASVGGMHMLLGNELKDNDSYLAYLPLAHILEYRMELLMLFSGVTVGYGRPWTLTDSSVINCKGDISSFRPSIMAGVPSVWETIKKEILEKADATRCLPRFLFNAAVLAKQYNVPVLARIAEDLVLSGVRTEVTGGRLRIGMSGGAVLNSQTREFLSATVVPIFQGYGLTESCGICAAASPALLRCNPRAKGGIIVPSVEVKLRDVPEAGYLTSNLPNPQGEVCIRGPSVSGKYFNRPDLNEDENIFDKDGWLLTGDIGQWNRDGTLLIIDRIKNLIKLQNGEYIALEALESMYKSCDLVSNICLHVKEDARQPMAVILPHEKNLRNALARRPRYLRRDEEDCPGTESLTRLCQDEGARLLILTACNEVGRRNGIRSVEMLSAVVLTPDEWTPENGLITAAQKVRRREITGRYKDKIKESYERNEAAVVLKSRTQ